jgi:hypothetical protein
LASTHAPSMNSFVSATAGLLKRREQRGQGRSSPDARTKGVRAMMLGVRGVSLWLAGCLAVTVALGGCGSSSEKSIPFSTPTTGAPPFSALGSAKPAGAFSEVAHDTNDGLSWKLSQAPGTGGATCWKLETGPSVDLIQSQVECRYPTNPRATDDFNTEWPFETGAKTGHDIFVGFVRKPIKGAEFQFVDNSTAKPVYINNDNGTVVWAGKSRPFMAAAQIMMADNSKIDCGPGDIQASAQLADKTDVEIVKARQFVWTCIMDV